MERAIFGGDVNNAKKVRSLSIFSFSFGPEMWGDIPISGVSGDTRKSWSLHRSQRRIFYDLDPKIS